MSKTVKVVILLLMAVVCAAASGIAVYYYCNSTKGFIYVFNSDYKAGTKITKDMFSSMKVDDEIIQSGQKSGIGTYYITGDNFTKVTNGNEYLIDDVSKNQPLTFNNLAFTSASAIERSLSSGTVAVTIPIGGAAAVTNDIRVGSIVNIYTVGTDATKLVFENMRIIARNEDASVAMVTFAAEPNDAIKLINIANNNRLYFSLAQPITDENKHSGYVEQR